MINLIEGFDNPLRRHMHRPRALAGIQIGIRQAFQIPIERHAHYLSCAIHHRAPIIAAANIASAHEIQRRHQAETRAGIRPTLRQQEGRLRRGEVK